MNKQQLIALMRSTAADLHISVNDVAVGFGGAMLLMGLREDTNDLDLDIPEAKWNYFRRRGNEVREGLLGNYIDLTDVVSIHPGIAGPTQVIDGVRCYTAQFQIECYRQFQKDPRRKPHKREQDQRSIDALEQLLRG